MKQQTLEQILKIAYCNPSTITNTYESVKLVAGTVYGHLVECGVAAGAQIAAMQAALKELNHNKAIYAFDSFEGIPLAGVYDDQQPGIGAIQHNPNSPERDRLISSGITVHDLESVKRNLINMDLDISNIHFIKGWFQDTLPEWASRIEAISLLRLDGDLYESTLVCLRYLYDKVSEGGIVIIDDFALPGCRKAIYDFFEEKKYPIPSFTEVPEGGGPVWFKKTNSISIFDDSIYNDEFFEWHKKYADKYSIDNMDWLMKEYRPQSVIDFGCGIGSYLLSAKRNGAASVLGYDIGLDSIRKFADPEIVNHIYKERCDTILSSIPEYDLVLCIETGEHIIPENSPCLVKNLCNACDKSGMIIFSAAPPGQEGSGHINCKPRSFWISLFEDNGFCIDAYNTDKISQAWHSQGCPDYIKNNLIVFIPNSI